MKEFFRFGRPMALDGLCICALRWTTREDCDNCPAVNILDHIVIANWK